MIWHNTAHYRLPYPSRGCLFHPWTPFRPFRSVLTLNRDRINLPKFIAPSDPCSVQLTWLTQLTVASPGLCFGYSDFAVGGSANLSTELGAVLSLYYVQTWQSIDNVPPLYRVNVNYADSISNYVRLMYFTIIDSSVLSVHDDKLRNAVENAEKRSSASGSVERIPSVR